MVNTHNNASTGLDLESTNWGSPADVPNFPYRRGLSCLLRGALGTFSTAVIAMTLWLTISDGLGTNISRNAFIPPLVAAGVSILINYTALISAILRRYGPRGHWKILILLDPVVFALGIWAFVMFAYNLRGEIKVEPTYRDQRGQEVTDMKPLLREAVAYLSLLIAIFHLIAMIGGAWGFVNVSMRKKYPGHRGPWITRWAHPASSGKVAHTGYPEPN